MGRIHFFLLLSFLSSLSFGASSYESLAADHEAGTKPTFEEARGWYGGRCFTKENRVSGALLMFHDDTEIYGPKFPQRQLAIALSQSHQTSAPNYFDRPWNKFTAREIGEFYGIAREVKKTYATDKEWVGLNTETFYRSLKKAADGTLVVKVTDGAQIKYCYFFFASWNPRAN